MKRTATTNYRDMTTDQAAGALQEYLDERGPARGRLLERLVADGQNPAVLLDGTPESLVPLWRWMLSRFTRARTPAALLTRPWRFGRSCLHGNGTCPGNSRSCLWTR